MGLLDKAKQFGQQAAEAAKKGTAQVQQKVEAAQTKKKADDLAQQLGYLIVRERNEGVPAAAEADRLVAEITALQAQLEAEAGDGADSSAAATPTPAASEAEAPPTSASETVTGDFKLEG